MLQQNLNKDSKKNTAASTSLLAYTSLSLQTLAALGFVVFVGLKVDKWLHLNVHLFAFVLPVLLIIALLIRIIKQTTKKK